MNYYFGCWSEAGHYLHTRGGAVVWDMNNGGPLNHQSADDCDRWCPVKTGQDERGERVTHLDHGGDKWTLWAMWDRTVDTRPGCFAMFIIRGADLTAEQCYRAALNDFPHITLRLQMRRKSLGGDLPWPETVF